MKWTQGVTIVQIMEALKEIDNKIEKEKDRLERSGLNLTHNELLLHDLKPDEE